MIQLLPGKDAVAASNLDLAREALVPELGAAGQVGLAALLDLGSLQLRETVVVDVALAVVALVRARLWDAGMRLASVLQAASSLWPRAKYHERAHGYETPQVFERSSEVPRGAWTRSDDLCSSITTPHRCT